jgi:hypothetical protein
MTIYGIYLYIIVGQWPYEKDTYVLYFYYGGVSQRACYKLWNRKLGGV